MQIDQALFGYSHGHRRLASSCPLTQGEERVLVRMTDLSGSRVAAGFDSYLSGYPLGQSGRYAVAKTWYAPECERPGCVWTHVLLLGPEDWDNTTSTDLLTAFCRPQDINVDLDRYTQQIGLGRSQVLSPRFELHSARMLCEAVYCFRNTVVVLWDERGNDLAPVILEMLWQRPEPLREPFSFCTGALSFLKINEQPLRLQVMPIRAAKSIRDQDITLLDLDSLAASSFGPGPELMAQDLAHPMRRYRDFLREMSEGWSGVTELVASEGMATFTEAFVALEEYAEGREDLAKILRLAARMPLEDLRFASLKIRLMKVLEDPQTAWAYVEGVLRGEYGDPIVREPISVEVARKVTGNGPERALHLIRIYLYPAQHESAKGGVIDGLLDGISLEFLTRKRPVEPQIVLAWIKHHPGALSDSRFWLLQSSFDESAEVAEAIEEIFSESAVLHALLRADRLDLLLLRLRAQGREGALKAFRLAGSLDVASSRDRLRLGALREEVSIGAEYVADVNSAGKDLSPGQLFVLGSAHLSPGRLLQLCPNQQVWAETLESLGGTFDPLQVKAFVLGIEQGGWWGIAELTFMPIYARMAERGLPYEDWSVLKRYLPKLAGWEKWDKCERLRRGFVEILRRDAVSLASLTKLTPDAEGMLRSTHAKYC